MTEEAIAAQAETDTPVENTVVETQATEVTAASDTEATSEKSQVIEIDDNQKAINKLAFEKREAKRQAKALEEENARLKAPPADELRAPPLPEAGEGPGTRHCPPPGWMESGHAGVQQGFMITLLCSPHYR